MSTDDLLRFYAPLMGGDHWKLLAQVERLRAMAIRKHEATH